MKRKIKIMPDYLFRMFLYVTCCTQISSGFCKIVSISHSYCHFICLHYLFGLAINFALNFSSIFVYLTERCAHDTKLRQGRTIRLDSCTHSQDCQEEHWLFSTDYLTFSGEFVRLSRWHGTQAFVCFRTGLPAFWLPKSSSERLGGNGLINHRMFFTQWKSTRCSSNG